MQPHDIRETLLTPNQCKTSFPIEQKKSKDQKHMIDSFLPQPSNHII